MNVEQIQNGDLRILMQGVTAHWSGIGHRGGDMLVYYMLVQHHTSFGSIRSNFRPLCLCILPDPALFVSHEWRGIPADNR